VVTAVRQSEACLVAEFMVAVLRGAEVDFTVAVLREVEVDSTVVAHPAEVSMVAAVLAEVAAADMAARMGRAQTR
jgi:hypothetical protein